MKLTVVRHGETNYNIKGLCSAVPGEQVYLTPKGVSQAETIAKKLKDEAYDIILVSEMYRSEQTAAIINMYHLRPMFIDDRINDRRSGMEDKPVSEWYKELEKKGDWFNGKVNDGESFLDVKKRVFAFLDELKKKTHLTSVLIVTHMAVFRMVKGYCQGLSDEEIWPLEVDNCQVEVFEL